ncbi:MAG TPA: ribose-5-phosphate isomerase RpiA [Flavisolibacter sp.]|nr:ribose-5-phosphate isomerase RpiA [Flavisolibacter sp.]
MSRAKKAAAERTVEFIRAGMTVGLGTGSTAYWAIQEVGKLVRQGMKLTAVASSVASEEEARKVGIEIVSFDGLTSIDIYIDGADETDSEKNLIKGGGGALLREKILAYNSKQFIVIVDETKLVKQLGKFHLPVEVVPFASDLTLQNIAKLACTPVVRMKLGKPFITDNGNCIVDCDFGSITNVEGLTSQLHAIPGVVEAGLFPHTMVSKVFVGAEDGTVRLL